MICFYLQFFFSREIVFDFLEKIFVGRKIAFFQTKK